MRTSTDLFGTHNSTHKREQDIPTTFWLLLSDFDIYLKIPKRSIICFNQLRDLLRAPDSAGSVEERKSQGWRFLRFFHLAVHEPPRLTYIMCRFTPAHAEWLTSLPHCPLQNSFIVQRKKPSGYYHHSFGLHCFALELIFNFGLLRSFPDTKTWPQQSASYFHLCFGRLL